jgi:hypothetical protein
VWQQQHHREQKQEQQSHVSCLTMQQYVSSLCGPRDSSSSSSSSSSSDTPPHHPLWDLLHTATATRQAYLQLHTQTLASSLPPSSSSSSSLVSSPSSHPPLYAPHLSLREINRGVQRGELVTGEQPRTSLLSSLSLIITQCTNKLYHLLIYLTNNTIMQCNQVS